MQTELLQKWVRNLRLFDQATLLASLRGIDHDERSDEVKPAVKMYRDLIVTQLTTKEKNVYSTDEVLIGREVAETILVGKDISNHWYEHFISAIKIVANKHPNNYTRKYWTMVISKIDKKTNKQIVTTVEDL